MLYRPRRSEGNARRAAAAVELALVAIPVLGFILVAATDFARVFYAYVSINSCARSGALYGCQSPTNAANTTGIQNAAINEAGGLQPALIASNVVPSTGTDADGNPDVSVKVTYPFTTIVNYPGIPHTMNISRTVEMRVAQTTPN